MLRQHLRDDTEILVDRRLSSAPTDARVFLEVPMFDHVLEYRQEVVAALRQVPFFLLDRVTINALQVAKRIAVDLDLAEAGVAFRLFPFFFLEEVSRPSCPKEDTSSSSGSASFTIFFVQSPSFSFRNLNGKFRLFLHAPLGAPFVG